MIQQLLVASTSLSSQLGIDRVAKLDEIDDSQAIFELQGDQLVLHMRLDGKIDTLRIELAEGEVASRANRASKSNEVIAKAIGCKPHYRPNVLDTTAGMGRDSLIMAMLGCRVSMQERSKAIYLLLQNALELLKNNSEIDPRLSDRLSLTFADSTKLRTKSDINIDVIYLDPMFPEKKKSALVKKEMRMFKRLVGEDQDANILLSSAMNKRVKRVVVKRPKAAPSIGNNKPDFEIKSKKFRFDIYLPNIQ